MIEFIMTNIWIILFYVYMGICAGIAEKIITGKFSEWDLLVSVFWPVPITIFSLIKIIKE